MNRARRLAQSSRDRRAWIRRAGQTHLHGSDVIARCTKCNGPIFRDSPNCRTLDTHNVGGSKRRRHKLCPQNGGER